MRAIILLFVLCTYTLKAQILNPIPDSLNKRILLSHPTPSNIEVIYALQQEKLLDTDNIQFIGLFHKDEAYDYSVSKAMLDTMSYLNMQLLEIKDTLFCDSLFCINQCSDNFKELFDESEGIIFFGGPDIPPAIYNEEKHPQTVVTDPYRHYFEASFLFHLLGGYQNNDYPALILDNPDYLIFGICLGMQTMNVATGGTLIQDIPLEIYNSKESQGLSHLKPQEVHRNFYPKMNKYKNDNLSGSHFHQVIFKDYFFPSLIEIESNLQPFVNSYHHQAVEELGKGFKAGATSSDGKIIEAIFHAHYPNVFGVQFHPERSQFYLQTKTFVFKPDDKACYLSDCLNEESMQFHVQFWKAINQLIQQL